MLSSWNLDTQRSLNRCGLAVVSLLVWACNAEGPVSPSSPPAPAPTSPAPRPATPNAPAGAKLTLSRPDVVFNSVAAPMRRDSTAVAITGATGNAVTELRATTRFAAGQPAGWLTAALDHSTLPATLTLTTGQTPLPPGEYTATVELKAIGAAAESVTVTRRVVAGAAIGLNASKICFTTTLGDTAHRDDVLVTSIDGSVIDGLTATIVYDAGQPTGWLSDSFNVTAAPARLWLKGSPGSLPSGTYTATVQVASPKAGNSPVPIRVTMTIKEGASTVHVAIRREGNFVGKARIHGFEPLGSSDIQCDMPEYPPGYNVCNATFTGGTGAIALFPDADYGEQLLRWEGCTDTSAGCVVEVTHPGSHITVTGVFGPKLSQRTLKVERKGPGTVLSDDRGIETNSCPATDPQPCASSGHYYELGTLVTLNAIPDGDATFVGWSGCPSPAGSSCDVSMTEDRSVVAQFASSPRSPTQRSLEVSMSGAYGTVSSGDGDINCLSTCRHDYELGTVVRLTAEPYTYGRFVQWVGCPTATGNVCEVLITESLEVVAEFVAIEPPSTLVSGKARSN